jgi:hypothetical protein
MTTNVRTGKNPDAKPCPRCGRSVGQWWGGKYMIVARHRNKEGKPCREKRAPRTDLDGAKKEGGLVSLPFPRVAYSSDFYLGAGKIDVLAGAPCELGAESSYPGIVRLVVMPGNAAENFEDAEIVIGEGEPTKVTLSHRPMLDRTDICLDDIPYAALRFRAMEWVKLRAKSRAEQARGFVCVFVVRVDNGHYDGPALWAVRESGPIEVAPGGEGLLVAPGGLPFKVEQMHLVGGGELVVSSLKVAGRENLAVPSVPGVMMTKSRDFIIETCPEGRSIEMVVRNEGKVPVVANLKLEGVEYDVRRRKNHG